MTTKGLGKICIFVSLLIAITGCSVKQQPIVEAQQKNEEKKAELNTKPVVNINPVAYEIIKTEDTSHKATGEKSLSQYTAQELAELPTDKKIRYRIVVSPDIKQNQVEPTINKIISDITNKDSDIDEIIILIYSDKKLANDVYDVATATWAPFGELGKVTAEIAKNNSRANYKVSIKITENLEEYLSQRNKTEDKLGLSEEKRKLIYSELFNAEKRAISEADKNYEKMDELLNKYNLEIIKKYSITEEQKKYIVAEAMTENW